jgi:hypothetical protein
MMTQTVVSFPIGLVMRASLVTGNAALLLEQQESSEMYYSRPGWDSMHSTRVSYLTYSEAYSGSYRDCLMVMLDSMSFMNESARIHGNRESERCAGVLEVCTWREACTISMTRYWRPVAR